MSEPVRRARQGLDEALERRREAHEAYLQASAVYVLAVAEHNRAEHAEGRRHDGVGQREALLEVLDECPTELDELRAKLLEEHVLQRRDGA